MTLALICWPATTFAASTQGQNSHADTPTCYEHCCDGLPLAKTNCQSTLWDVAFTTEPLSAPIPFKPLGVLQHWISQGCQAQWVQLSLLPTVTASSLTITLSASPPAGPQRLLWFTSRKAVSGVISPLQGFHQGEQLQYQARGFLSRGQLPLLTAQTHPFLA